MNAAATAAATAAELNLSFSAQNCNSLNVCSSINNQDKKISAILGYKSDVIMLSDVRLNGRERVICDGVRLWYKVYSNSSRNSRGVAILVSNQVDHQVLETAADPQENVLLLKIKFGNREIAIGSVYGPNTDNCGAFFDFIRQTLNRWQNISCIMGGDWNATLSGLPVLNNPDVLFM